MAQTAIDCSLQVPVVSIKQEAQLVLWTLINISELLRTLGGLILRHPSTWGGHSQQLQPYRDGHYHHPWGGIPAWARRHEGKQSKLCFSVTHHIPPAAQALSC